MIHKFVRPRGAKGFTLIEILVVVSIIALLISILLPSLNKAREQTRMTMCGKNLSQIFTASYTYAHSYRDRLPNFGWVIGTKGRDWWVSQVSKELGMQVGVYRCHSDQKPHPVWYRRDGNALIVDNREDGGKPSDGYNWSWMGISYSGVCDLVDEDISDRTGRVITSYRHPAMNLMLVEGQLFDSTQPYLCITYEKMFNMVYYAGRRGYEPLDPSWRRHGKKSNMLFLDGHVGRHTTKELTHRILWQQQNYHGDMPNRPADAYLD